MLVNILCFCAGLVVAALSPKVLASTKAKVEDFRVWRAKKSAE